jgi:hypothetical protein
MRLVDAITWTYVPLSLGSSVSLRLSPTMLKLKTRSMIAKPGKRKISGFVQRN